MRIRKYNALAAIYAKPSRFVDEFTGEICLVPGFNQRTAKRLAKENIKSMHELLGYNKKDNGE